MLCMAMNSQAQKRFEFNAKGNTCFFSYICYSPTDNYSFHKRAFLVVVGNPGESVEEVFQRDTLKLMPRFFSYMLVYVPADQNNPLNQVSCYGALSHLLTLENPYSKQNIFLYYTNPDVDSTAILNSTIKSDFKQIKFADRAKSVAPVQFELTSVEEAEMADLEEGGTYYIDETVASDGAAEEEKVVEKTYFGPPTQFNYTLSGVVQDRYTGESLPFARVQLKYAPSGATANADGFFTLVKVPSDTTTLQVTYVGYDPLDIFLTPQMPSKNLVIKMSTAAQMLKGVVIEARREDVVLISKNDVGLIKMTPKKLEKLPNIGERDVMRSFQLMPGISAANESSSGLYVRGGTPDQNLVLYDGFTVYHVDHLYGFFSAFNTNAIKDVQLYKGGFESKFGGRLSSITEITGKEGNKNRFNAGLDLSLLSLNGFIETPIGKKFTALVAYRRSYKGLIYNKIFEKFNSDTQQTVQQGPGGPQMGSTTVENFFYDLNGKFTFRPNQKDILTASIFNGTDKLDNSSDFSGSGFGGGGGDFSQTSTDLTRYGNIGLSMKWSRKWNDKLYGNTIASYSNYYSKRDRSMERTRTDENDETTTVKDGIIENNDLRDYSFKSEYEWDIASFSQLQFGGYATYFDVDYSYAQNDTASVLERHDNAVLWGGYLQNEFKFFKEKISFMPGVRYSYYDQTNQWYTEPRAQLSLHVTDKITLKGATGRYYQFATRVTREDILSGSRDFWLMADGSKIPVSSAIHYITGLSYENNDYLFSVEGYYKTLSDLTEYSLRFDPNPRSVDYSENFFNGKGYSKGVEFLAQRKAGDLNGWVSYTLGQAKSYFDVYGDTYFPANQDVTHEFKAVGLYKYKRWDFSATWVYATGRPYTAPSGGYTVTLLDGTTQEFFTVTTKNGLRLPDYHRMDLAVNFKLLAGMKGEKRRREIGYVGFSIFNVYNRTNIWYKQYSIEDGDILETNVNYLGFTPNINLSLKIR